MKHIIAIFFLIVNCFVLNAQTITQEVKASGGGYYKQINGSMQFTIGEPLTEKYSNTSAKLYQGFEQGSYSIVSVSELPILADLDVILYPNPSSCIFNLHIESNEVFTFRMDVFNAQGETIIHKEITSENIDFIDLSGFASSIYYVSITNADKNYLKTFKIIKQ